MMSQDIITPPANTSECHHLDVEQRIGEALARLPTEDFLDPRELGKIIFHELPQQCLNCAELTCMNDVTRRTDLCFSILEIMKEKIPKNKIQTRISGTLEIDYANFYGEVVVKIVELLTKK